MTVDLGTGNGRFVLERAAARPDELVLGVDASHTAMAEASRRASRPARRGGLRNACFIVAAAESLPDELHGLAGLVTVHFPWGSLLNGALGTDLAVASRITALLGRGGRLRMLLSAAPRDVRRGIVALETDAVASTYQRLGLTVDHLRPATVADARAVRSAWGLRLLASRNSQRQAWLIEFVRPR